MILNCNVLHQIEAEKIPPMEPNEPTDLRNIALNSEFGEKAIWRNDLLPLYLPGKPNFRSHYNLHCRHFTPFYPE